MKRTETELQLLQTIYSTQGESGGLSQRNLASAADLSLGMTNALLKRFAERGWIKLSHISGRSLRYAMTPAGIEEVFRRTISYFTRAVRSASLYRDRIDVFVVKASAEGFTVLVLEGPEELDFLFDYSCERHGMSFIKNPSADFRADLAVRPDVVFVAADLKTPSVSVVPISASKSGASSVQLSTIIIGDPLR